MRSKKGRRAKASGRKPKTRSRNAEAEVFVLTPNILQKLGINLEKIGDTDEYSPIVNNELVSQNVHCGPINCKNDDSESSYHSKINSTPNSLEPVEDNSNLVTINLIKESLLLSPFFQEMNSKKSDISNNIEELEPKSAESLTYSRRLDFSNHVETSEDKDLNPKQNFNGISPALEQLSNGPRDCLPLQQIMVQNELTDVNENYTQALSNDDHTDEAYLSDCSNSNLESQEYPNIIDYKVQPKIEIINEEILNSSQLREIQKLHKSQISNCVHISLSSLITGKNTKEYNTKDNTENINDFDIRESDNTISQKCNAPKEELKKNSSFDFFDKQSDASIIDVNQIHSKDIIKDNFEILKYCLGDNAVPQQSEMEKNRLNSLAESENQTSENILRACIDLSVADIEMHIKEDEEILEKFAKELTSYDNDVILNKIENNEIDNFNSLQPDKVLHKISNNLHEVVSETDFVTNRDLGGESYLCCCNDTSNTSLDFGIDRTENRAEFIYPKPDNTIIGFGNSEPVYESPKNECITKTSISTNNDTIKQKTNLDQNNVSCERYLSSNYNIYFEDKVEEIAKYLKQFNKRKSELLSNYVNESNSRQKMHGKYKLRVQGVEKPGGSKEYTEEKRPNVFKTYVKKINPSRKTESIALQSFKEKLDYVPTNIIDLDPEPNIEIKQRLASTLKFCLCEDFGKMYYYESENVYEHIHFWEHVIIDCDEQLLFSIYNNEGCDIFYKRQNSPVATHEQISTDKESLHLVSTSICWNTFVNHVDNKSATKNTDNIDVETNACVKLIKDNTSVNKDGEPVKTKEDLVLVKQNERQELKEAETSDENVSHKNYDGCNSKNVKQLLTAKGVLLQSANTAGEQRLANLTDDQMLTQKGDEILQSSNQETTTRLKSTKKRKISDVSLTESNKADLAIKRSVKCGMCKQVFGENEWQDHIVKHNFITWKEGTNIDFKDPNLLTNLKEKLKKDKTLSCPVCSSVYKKLRLFLTHLEKCLTLGSKSDDVQADFTQNTSSVVDISELENYVSPDNKAIEKTSDFAIERMTCGVCNENMPALEWIDHIALKHNYIAWKSGQKSLELNEEEKLKHLSDIIKEIGHLTCSICGTIRKRARHFVTHLKKCKNKEEDQTNTNSNTADSEVCSEDDPKKTEADKVTCGVCAVKVNRSSWYDHMGKEHEYLAWLDGEEKLDTSDETIVKSHLNAISKMYGSLICCKCGHSRKYVKPYMDHVRQCTGEVAEDNTLDVTVDEQNKTTDSTNIYKCGVCGKQVPADDWIRHIKMWHYYMAWKEEEFWDLKDKDSVKKHLEMILQEDERLQCIKCNTEFKTVSSYQKHSKSCKSKLIYVCAVCSQQMDPTDWEKHKMTKHYNVAWIVGEPPININNPTSVERLIKEYKNKYKKLICKICSISRVSCMGFYAHIIVCGKTEEEADLYKKICNICNKKYLCVYENQHMTYHRERELALEKKQKQQEVKEEDKAVSKAEEEEAPTGTRRAAQKARSVIEKYQKDTEQDRRTETRAYSFDSDGSVKIESEAESDDSEVDSDISDAEENFDSKRRRFRDHKSIVPKIDRYPFKPKDVESYLDACGKEFINFHYKPIQVFSDWYTNDWEPVAEENLAQYTPPIKESCKIKLQNDSWNTCKRFEGKRHNPSTGLIFTGGCVQSVAWIPPVPDVEDEHGHYLAIIGNLDSDFPKIKAEDVQPRSGLIQIWDFGEFKCRPKFALGLAHDFGIAWAMDWCPNGARDVSPTTEGQISRLGLLAVAFSNGSAYIFSVLYPQSIIKNENLLYKLKPSVELRLSMTERPMTQATSINWSLHGKLDTIVVGYSDGTTAFYDLNTKSPLLRSTEKGVAIVYPYYDNRLLNTCITGVSTYPSMDENAPFPISVSSPTGSMLVTRFNTTETIQYSSLSSADICFQSLWPSALIACEESGSAAGYINELEWLGSGRRLGAGKAAAACERCDRAALALPPAITVVRRHPVNDLSSKRIVALINICPLGKKRKIKNDDLQAVVEPSTYEGAVTKYGIEVVVDKSLLNNARPARDVHPGRFPLADITSMKFCPSAAHHNRLAVSTHAGIVLIVTV